MVVYVMGTSQTTPRHQNLTYLPPIKFSRFYKKVVTAVMNVKLKHILMRTLYYILKIQNWYEENISTGEIILAVAILSLVITTMCAITAV